MSTTTQIPPKTAEQYARLVQDFRDSISNRTNGVVVLNELLIGYAQYWGSIDDDRILLAGNLSSFLSELDKIPDPE